MADKNVVSVSEMDYLEEDAPIRGQEYVCLSFLSPEKILDNKDVFTFTKFTQNFCKEVRELFENLTIKYPDEEDGFKSIADRYRFLLMISICKKNINTLWMKKQKSLTKNLVKL